jgi:hypothetical protein
MRRLGHPLTWKTHCFINGGCGDQVFAHTNGDGDFVLFDSLGWPWPIHECYQFRTSADGLSQTPSGDWQQVRSVEASSASGRVEIIGTVTNYEEARLGGYAGFRQLSRQAQNAVRARLGECRSLITVVTGRGEEYLAFADLRDVVVAVHDTVAARLRPVELLNTFVFKVTQIKRIEY